MRFLLILIMAGICLQISFKANASSKISKQLELESETISHYIVEEYSQKLYDVESLINSIAKTDAARAKKIEDYFQSQYFPLNTKLPPIKFDGKSFFYKDQNQLNMKFTITNHIILVEYDGKSSEFTKNTSPAAAFKMMSDLIFPKTTSLPLFLLIPTAHADGIGEAAGIAVSGITSATVFALLHAYESVGKFFSDIASLPASLNENRIRDNASKACDAIQNNKAVKNLDKIKEKLSLLKSKVECVPYWESDMLYSCGWFDERLECLSKGSLEVSNTQRVEKKEPIEDLKLPISTTSK